MIPRAAGGTGAAALLGAGAVRQQDGRLQRAQQRRYAFVRCEARVAVRQPAPNGASAGSRAPAPGAALASAVSDKARDAGLEKRTTDAETDVRTALDHSPKADLALAAPGELLELLKTDKHGWPSLFHVVDGADAHLRNAHHERGELLRERARARLSTAVDAASQQTAKDADAAAGEKVLADARAANEAADEKAIAILRVCPALAQMKDVRGLTVLHVAAWRGRTRVVRHILEEILAKEDADGAERDSLKDDGVDECHPQAQSTLQPVTRWGETPLHHAVQQGHLEVVEYLMGLHDSSGNLNAAATDPDAEDMMGRSARRLALSGCNQAKERLQVYVDLLGDSDDGNASGNADGGFSPEERTQQLEHRRSLEYGLKVAERILEVIDSKAAPSADELERREEAKKGLVRMRAMGSLGGPEGEKA